MKIDVHSFFDGYEGEEMAENVSCNKERIKELTMNKIYSEKKTGKLTKGARIAIIAAAVMVLLTGTVFAAVMGSIHVTKTDDVSEEDIGAYIDVDKIEGIDSTLIAMIPSYQPELNEAEVDETLGYLQANDGARYYASYIVNSAKTGITDMCELDDYEIAQTEEAINKYKEENGTDTVPEEVLAQIYDEVYNSLHFNDDVNALLDKYNIFDEKYKNALVHIYRNDGEKGWGADAKKDAEDTRYTLTGDVNVVKEDTLKGMSAVYIENRYDIGEETYDMNVIALRDETTGIMLTVYGTVSFEELEKVAEGMEMIDTGLPCPVDNSGFGGLLAGMAQG